MVAVEIKLRDNLYATLRIKRKKEVNCIHCNKPVLIGERHYSLVYKDGERNRGAGVLHEICFPLYDGHRKEQYSPTPAAEYIKCKKTNKIYCHLRSYCYLECIP